MLSPETYPTMYPFSAAVCHGTACVPLSYRTMILGPSHLYPLSSAKRYYPRHRHGNGASSFTIDAILGLQEDAQERDSKQRGVDEAVCELALRRQLAASAGAKLPSPHCSLPAAHAFLPAPAYLFPPSEDGHTIGRPDLQGRAGSRQHADTDKDRDFEFLETFKTIASGRKSHDQDSNMCTGVKRPASLGWPDVEVQEPTSKPKRVRTIFTQDQLDRLETEFARQQYMVGTERLYLAAQLDLSESQVKVWFQNRRIKWRKQNLESQQEKLAQYRALREKERQAKHDEGGHPAGTGDANSEDEDRVSNDIKTSKSKEQGIPATKTASLSVGRDDSDSSPDCSALSPCIPSHNHELVKTESKD